MLTIKTKNNILVVTKDENKEQSSDMYLQEADDDKRLITCEVVSWSGEYQKGEHVITGRYSLYQLTYNSEDYFFLDCEDVLGTLKLNV